MTARAHVDVGERFGRLVVIAITVLGIECSCDCGRSRTVPGRYVFAQARTPSCGCARGAARVTHGRSGSRLHLIWCGMRARCNNRRDKSWKLYGGRGIKVCARWMKSFEAFAADMGEPPTNRHSLDRKDNDGNYEPGNCRWTTQDIQSQNSRHTKLTIADVDDIRRRIADGAVTTDLAKEFGVAPCTIAYAARGIHFKNATEKPVTIERSFATGERHGQSKLTADIVRVIRRDHAAGVSQAELARRFEVHCVSIRQVITGQTWRHVDAEKESI